uniref:Uncharacterized protein n=1 Tax=Arundo donax TaxID=35708 RepID=A0A0A9DUR3_ARUDO
MNREDRRPEQWGRRSELLLYV